MNIQKKAYLFSLFLSTFIIINNCASGAVCAMPSAKVQRQATLSALMDAKLRDEFGILLPDDTDRGLAGNIFIVPRLQELFRMVKVCLKNNNVSAAIKRMLMAYDSIRRTSPRNENVYNHATSLIISQKYIAEYLMGKQDYAGAENLVDLQTSVLARYTKSRNILDSARFILGEYHKLFDSYYYEKKDYARATSVLMKAFTLLKSYPDAPRVREQAAYTIKRAIRLSMQWTHERNRSQAALAYCFAEETFKMLVPNDAAVVVPSLIVATNAQYRLSNEVRDAAATREYAKKSYILLMQFSRLNGEARDGVCPLAHAVDEFIIITNESMIDWAKQEDFVVSYRLFRYAQKLFGRYEMPKEASYFISSCIQVSKAMFHSGRGAFVQQLLTEAGDIYVRYFEDNQKVFTERWELLRLLRHAITFFTQTKNETLRAYFIEVQTVFYNHYIAPYFNLPAGMSPRTVRTDVFPDLSFHISA